MGGWKFLQTGNMRAFTKRSFIWIGLCVLSGIVFLLYIQKFVAKNYPSEKKYDVDSSFRDDPYTIYSGDSIYKVVYDTIVRVWNTSSGEKLNEFSVSVSGYPEYPEIRQMELDLSGKYLAFLDNLNIARVYNIFTGECEGVNDYYFDQSSHIYFSDDSKYFLIVDFREAEVNVLSCPGLEYIATGFMGYYRSSFYWENLDGKLVFYYEVVDSLYRTVFPDDGHSDSLVFSKPVNVNKVKHKIYDGG
jgi:WD40 repeat protein